MVLGGGERLVVLANGEDQPVWGGSREFPVDSDVFSYTMSTANPDASWKNVGFDDSSWMSDLGNWIRDGDDDGGPQRRHVVPRLGLVDTPEVGRGRMGHGL